MDEKKELHVVEAEEVIYFGDAVKALGDGRVGGYLVRFSTDDDPDLVEEFFNKSTDFGEADSSPVYYNHALDPVLKKRKLGKATLKKDDVGVWAEAQLKLRDEYEKFIYEMTEAGKMGWSSGTASHLVEKEPVGKATWIKSWPLGLDASLTPTPAEPRNGALPLKALTVEPLKESDELMDAPAQESAAQDGEGEPKVKGDKLHVETPAGDSEDLEMEITEEKLNELIDAKLAAKEADAPEEEKPDVKQMVADGVEEALKKLPALKADVKVTKDEADQPFESGGEFFQAVKTAYLYPGTEDVRLKSLKATGLSENVPADGGYLLAPQIASGMIDRMYDVGRVLGMVANMPVGPNANSVIMNGVDETSRANGSRYGGVQGYWTAEAGSITASNPTFRQIELKLKKVAALVYATDELLADAVALGSYLGRVVPEELRFKVEDAIINGDGVGKPLGIMQSPALNSVTRVDANEVDATDIANMWSRRWPGANDYVWFINTSVFPQLINLTVGNFPLLLPVNGGAQGDPGFTIYGRPVYTTEYTAALGTSGDIMLASMSQYQTITKGGVQAASSIHVQFAAAETAFRFIYRIDGQPLWHSTLTPFDAGNALSPFVVLTAASA